MYADLMLQEWAKENVLRAPSMKNEPAFYRNLERALDVRRQENSMIGFKPRWDDTVLDFTTCDVLSLNRTGQIREAFLEELARYPDFHLGAAGSRSQYGNYDYLNEVEQEIADFHGAESAYITATGFLANVAALSGVPQPGDAIVYDELVHASCHEGFHLSLAEHKLFFRHNDPDALREVLIKLKKMQPAFQDATRSILLCVESIYGMDGDECPLQELVDVLKQEFPLGNAQILVDEAHSLGIIGERGKGLVSMLGLEKEIAIRVHVATKALASAGGIILCNNTVRYMLFNHARSIIFSGAPSFAVVASIRVGYKFLMNGESQEAQAQIQRNVRHFFETITSNAIWDEAVDSGLLSIPILEDWEERDFHSHIVPLRTRTKHEQYLFFHLLLNNINAYPMAFPVVPKGQPRMRLVFHAHNTFAQVEKLASTICDWAREMLEIENGDSEKMLPSTTRQAYAKVAGFRA